MEEKKTDELPGEEQLSACSPAEKPPIERETIEKAMRGDKEAFSVLFMQTYRTMYQVVRRLLARDEDVYDALQDGYTRAYKYLPRLQAPEAFLSWLKKTMENAARDLRADITGQRTVGGDIEAFPDGLAAEYTEDSDRRADIQEVLARLDARQAEVLTLYYYDGMKLSEIARLLGEPPSTVRSRFAQAKKALVEQLKVKGIDKSMYSGSVSAMIAVSLRALIGTDILSAATAQQMLDEILDGRHGHLGEAAYKLLEARRNRAVLKAVSLLMAMTVAVTCVTVALLNGYPWKWFSQLPAAVQPESSALPPDGADFSGGIPSGGTTAGEDAPTTASGGTTAPGQTSSDGTVPTTSGSQAPPASSGDEPTAPAVFIPDYRPGMANTAMRNPTWRAALGGAGKNGRTALWDWQDEWMYVDIGGTYYKSRRDGTGGFVEIEHPPYTSLSGGFVLGDWIYCSGSNENGVSELRRVRTDGAVIETLAEAPANPPTEWRISGFLLYKDRLVYSEIWTDAFGVEQFAYHAYDPATGEDERLGINGKFSLRECLPVGDWFVDLERLKAYSLDGDEVSFYELREQVSSGSGDLDWQLLRGRGFFPAFVLGEELYLPTGECIDFSEKTPRMREVVPRRIIWGHEGIAHQVEFIDEATGRLAVTVYDEQGIYPEAMRWYSEEDGWGEELPAVLLRNSQDQTYQTDGEGYVFSTTADGTWFSCRMDGSDYREYRF